MHFFLPMFPTSMNQLQYVESLLNLQQKASQQEILDHLAKQMRRLPFLLICFIMLSVLFPVHSAYNPQILVQGFYWDGQGEYSHQQRRALLAEMPANSVYIHMPQEAETLQVWNSSELAQWQTTKSVCAKNSIQLIVGIRTSTINDSELTLYLIEKKIRQLDVPFVLGWDDCDDGETEQQKRLQLGIVQKLSRKPWAIVPGAYFAEDGNITDWLQRLSIINDADTSIPFILCSKYGYTPAQFNAVSDFPPLKRKMLFWDNWMAVDELARFPRNLPRNRDHRLFDAGYPYGYMLNLCFPPERIIHGLKSIAYQQQQIPYNYTQISSEWATYLIKHKFITEDKRSEMQGALYQLIYNYEGTMNVTEIVKQYPILGAFLYDK